MMSFRGIMDVREGCGSFVEFCFDVVYFVW